MAIASAKAAKPLIGHSHPRLAPPIPALSLSDDLIAAAAEMDFELMPWQVIAGRYMTALNKERWRYREVAIVVARQNGKTRLLLPRVLLGLRRGEKILHTAQNRSLPRETFLEIAALLAGSEFITDIRQANGQETIKAVNGGRYTLVAPRPGVRGHAVDTVILDEVREQRNFELMAGIKPTITASRNPQIIYLSNAGDMRSLVLNDLRRRSEKEAAMAYLEWSAAPMRPLSDHIGWAEANPALGTTIQLETLEDNYRSLPSPVWETEHLCRWVISMQPRVVNEAAWERGRRDELENPLRPQMAVSLDSSGTRASVAMAWGQEDGTVAVEIVEDINEDPIDVDKLGKALRNRAMKAGVIQVAFASWTDSALARHFDNAKPLDGREFANASENFARLVESGRLQWRGSDAISDDLIWLARKPHESGAWQAIKVDEEHSVTAALAAIRAVWLASAPKSAAPQIF